MGITLVSQLNNPSNRYEKHIFLTACARKTATSRVEMFMYVRGLYDQKKYAARIDFKWLYIKTEIFSINVYFRFTCLRSYNRA
jgi:hypothetical protein